VNCDQNCQNKVKINKIGNQNCVIKNYVMVKNSEIGNQNCIIKNKWTKISVFSK